jgi:hypothetical protein
VAARPSHGTEKQEFARMLPRSQHTGRVSGILQPSTMEDGMMRSYVVATLMAFGLVAVWAAIVPFVA